MGKKILFFIVPLILSIGISPALPFVNAAFDNDSVCREGLILFHRTNANDYVCLSMESAEIRDRTILDCAALDLKVPDN